MAVVGRGKGRGFVEVREGRAKERRPGHTLSSEYHELINLIDNLTLKDNISNLKMKEIVDMIRESIKHSSIKDIFEVLYSEAMEDSKFGIKLATICGDSRLYSIDDGDDQFRKVVMGKIQRDYEYREEVKKESITHFHNAIIFLGTIYNNYVCNGRLRVLVSPILDYLSMLLEVSEEEDIEITMTQMYINGRFMYEKCPTEMDDFIMRVKILLINRNLSARSRGMLLYIIDLANNDFVSLPKKLQEFYENEFGTEYFEKIKNSDKDLKDVPNNTNLQNNINYKYRPKNKLEQSSAVDNFEDTVTKTIKQEKKKEFGLDEKSSNNTAIERASIPRAIRGAGAADSIKDKSIKKSPRIRKDKLTDEQMWSSKQNTSSKVWGHDDRFDKNYY